MSSNAITVRNAKADDFDVIFEFICELGNQQFDKTTLEMLYANNILNENNFYVVADHEGKVSGFASCHSQYLLHHGGLVGEIQEIFVKEGSRSIGIGKLLMEEIRKKSMERGLIQLEVTAANKRTLSHQFYIREGFELSHKKFVLTFQ